MPEIFGSKVQFQKHTHTKKKQKLICTKRTEATTFLNFKCCTYFILYILTDSPILHNTITKSALSTKFKEDE